MCGGIILVNMWVVVILVNLWGCYTCKYVGCDVHVDMLVGVLKVLGHYTCKYVGGVILVNIWGVFYL